MKTVIVLEKKSIGKCSPGVNEIVFKGFVHPEQCERVVAVLGEKIKYIIYDKGEIK